jgi:hypothetical protein
MILIPICNYEIGANLSLIDPNDPGTDNSGYQEQIKESNASIEASKLPTIPDPYLFSRL